MTRERLGQIRQAVDHNPRGADYYVDELLRACGTLLGQLDEARAETAKVREVMRQNTADAEEEIAAAQTRADEWRRDANAIAKERDDAREELAKLRKAAQ